VKHDIIIIGGGIVGLILANTLATDEHTRSLSILVLEKGTPPEPISEDKSDAWVSALNPSSEQLLRSVETWVEDHATPFKAMQVWEQNSTASIQFHHEDLRQPHLGHIVTNRALQYRCFERAASTPQMLRSSL
jgi:2-polyprenylphenol 6-hydroxylase